MKYCVGKRFRDVKQKNIGASMVSEDIFPQTLAAFGFPRMKKTSNNFYKSYFNFPKDFLGKNVEKSANALFIGILILIHIMLIFEGLK